VSDAPKPQVDTTRTTPWGAQWRVVRAETVGIDSENRWAVMCLAHGSHTSHSSMKPAFELGTRGRVADWCDACRRMRDGEPEPPKRRRGKA